MSGIKGKSGVYKRSEKHGKNISLSKMGCHLSEETKIKIGKANSKPSKYSSEEISVIKKARRDLNNAVRDGRVSRLLCVMKYGCKGRVEGHHEDYSKPLEVVWMCRLHHERYHRNKPELLK